METRKGLYQQMLRTSYPWRQRLQRSHALHAYLLMEFSRPLGSCYQSYHQRYQDCLADCPAAIADSWSSKLTVSDLELREVKDIRGLPKISLPQSAPGYTQQQSRCSLCLQKVQDFPASGPQDVVDEQELQDSA